MISIGLLTLLSGFLFLPGGGPDSATGSSESLVVETVPGKNMYLLESSTRRGMAYKMTPDTGNSVMNPTLRATNGETVTILFRNQAGDVHDLVIPAFDVDTGRLYGNKTTKISFVADQPGTYSYFCSVGGHRRAGMEGRLIVHDSSSPSRDRGDES